MGEGLKEYSQNRELNCRLVNPIGLTPGNMFNGLLNMVLVTPTHVKQLSDFSLKKKLLGFPGSPREEWLRLFAPKAGGRI